MKIDDFIRKPVSANDLPIVKKHIKNETKNEVDKDIIDNLDIPAAWNWSGCVQSLYSRNSPSYALKSSYGN
jgi:hypothetical protein